MMERFQEGALEEDPGRDGAVTLSLTVHLVTLNGMNDFIFSYID